MAQRAAVLISMAAFSLVASIVSASEGVLSPATQQFLIDKPGTRAIISQDRLTGLCGVTFASDDDSETTTLQFAEAFLAANQDAFGVEGVELVHIDDREISKGKFRVFAYGQEIENLPVHGAVVKFTVLLGETEKIGCVCFVLKPHPPAALPEDVISAAEAVEVVENSQEYGHLTTFTTPEKVVFEDDQKILHRAWHFQGDDGEEYWRFFVDTNSEAIVSAEDAADHADVTVSGRVTGWGTPGTKADQADPEDPETCPVEFSLESIEMRLISHASPPTTRYTFTSSEGLYEFQDVSDEHDVTVEPVLAQIGGSVYFINDWVRVRNTGQSGPLVPTSDPMPFDPTDPEVDLEQIDFVFGSDCSDLGGFYERDQVNAYTTVTKTHHWFKNLTNDERIDQRVLVSVNFRVCPTGLFVNGEIRVGYPDETNECRSGAFSTLISHEYGHFIQHRLMVGSNVGANSAFTEGTADVIAAFLWDTPCMFEDHLLNEPCIRDLDGSNLILGVDCQPGQTGHYCGQVIGGAFWHMRENLISSLGESTGKQTADQIFADYMETACGQFDYGILTEVLCVDDDDADISNGTPHDSEIVSAFALHGFTDPRCPDESVEDVIVAWVGPLSPPQEGTDYNIFMVLEDGECLPHVVLRTGYDEVSEIDVLEWHVGRSDGEGAPLPLGSVTANWINAPEAAGLTVRAGLPASDIHVQDVNIVLISRPGGVASKYSSVVLEPEGSLKVRAKAESASDTTGGRISGNVPGDLGAVEAQAIGTSATDPGQLYVGRLADRLLLQAFPATATLTVGSPPEPWETASDPSTGTIEIKGDLSGTLRLLHRMEGHILVDGDIDGTLRIEEDMSGDILADADADESGDVVAVTAIGTFEGNVCGDNLTTWETGNAIPAGLDMAFGPAATICGQTVCETTVSAPEEEPSPLAKNRFITFEPPSDLTASSAIRVRLNTLERPRPDNPPSSPAQDFSDFERDVRWLGPLVTYDEPVGSTTFKASALQCQPYFTDWSETGVIQVFGEEIVPSSQYEVRMVREGDQCVSEALLVTTARWADVASPFQDPQAQSASQPSVLDISALVDTIKGTGGAIAKVRGRIFGDAAHPAVDVTAADVTMVVDALKGVAFPFAGPQECP